MGLVHTRRSQQFIRKYNQIGTLTDTITPHTTRLDSSNMPQTWAVAKLLQHAWQPREQFSGENMYALILRFTRMKKPIKIAFYKHGNKAVSRRANQLQNLHPKLGTKKWTRVPKNVPKLVGRWQMEQLTALRHICMRAQKFCGLYTKREAKLTNLPVHERLYYVALPPACPKDEVNV